MPTQKDIAKRLGVSTALVSRVLSGKAREIGIADRTAERIRVAARQAGYVPNQTARMLRGAPARTLGVVVYDFEDPFFGTLVGAIQRLAHAAGFSLVLVGMEHRRIQLSDLQPLLKHRVDGLIIAGSGTNVGWLDILRPLQVPVVRIGTGPAHRGMLSIAVDDTAGFRDLMRHVAAAGRQRAGFLGGSRPLHKFRARAAREAAEAAGISLDSRSFFFPANDMELTAVCRRMCAGAMGRKIDVFIAANDMMALRALRVLTECGMRVPADIAVTGYDDIPQARLAIPSLTTLRQPIESMAGYAVDWIRRESHSRPRDFGPVVCPPRLIVRESA